MRPQPGGLGLGPVVAHAAGAKLGVSGLGSGFRAQGYLLGSTDVQGRSWLPAWTAELWVEVPFPPASLGLPSRLVCEGEVGIWVQAEDVPGSIWSPDVGGLSCPWRNQAQRGGGAELRLASPDSQPRTSPLLCPWQVGRLRQTGHIPAWHGRGRKYDRRVFSWLVFRALSCFLFPRADGN